MNAVSFGVSIQHRIKVVTQQWGSLYIYECQELSVGLVFHHPPVAIQPERDDVPFNSLVCEGRLSAGSASEPDD